MNQINIRDGILYGALAGLIGGVIFGLALFELGELSMFAHLAGKESGTSGLFVLMLLAGVAGAGFGALLRRQRAGAGEMLFWGMAYGVLLWVLGTLTLMPLSLQGALTWDFNSAKAALPSLIGLILAGGALGLAYAALRGTADEASMVALLRGLIVGLVSAWWLGGMLNSQGQLPLVSQMMGSGSETLAWLLLLLLGGLSGLGYAALFPRPKDGLGAGLIRGLVFGFFWWVLGALTILPLVGGNKLDWSAASIRDGFALFPGFLLSGMISAVLYQCLGGIVRALFSDHVSARNEEGVGARGLRALGRGALAGIAGGLLFTLVMIQVGFLSTVASLIRSESPLTGFLVHLVISILIGASYGLLFRRQSHDLGSALGWGVSYGFVWWILGPLTLLPALLGATPEWSAAVAAQFLPSLVGHLAYGAALGIIFYAVEARFTPWWITRKAADVARVALRREQALTSSPALWVFVVAIALVIPIVLGMEP